MKVFRLSVLLNGSENSDYYEQLTNLWQLKSGLKTNGNQAVLYYNLASAINPSGSFLSKIIGHFAGNSYINFLDDVYKDVLNKIKNAIYFNQVEKNGTVSISLFGFGVGATLARHFAVEYIKNRLSNELSPEIKQAAINIKLDAEYLFDCVRLPATSGFSRYFKASPAGFYSHIPSGTRAYHVVSIDDYDSLDRPLLVDQENDSIEEVWFAGDQLDIGGGHITPAHDSPLGASDVLNYMVMRAKQNGIEFTDDFLQKLTKEKNSKVLSVIHNRSWYLPINLREVRAVYVQKNGMISDELPLVHESVIRRMQNARVPDYQPTALLPFAQMRVLKEDGKRASARFVEQPITPILTRFKHENAKASHCKVRSNISTASPLFDANAIKAKCR